MKKIIIENHEKLNIKQNQYDVYYLTTKMDNLHTNTPLEFCAELNESEIYIDAENIKLARRVAKVVLGFGAKVSPIVGHDNSYEVSRAECGYSE